MTESLSGRGALLALIVLVLTLLACGKGNPAATAKCKSSTSSGVCSTCCRANGSNGHVYSGSSGCKCM